MCSKRYLQCAVYGCICVANEPCQQCAKGRAPQSRTRTIAAIRSSAGRRHTNEESFWCLSPASISLPSGGGAPEPTASRRGRQDRFHSETFTRVSPTPSRFRERHQSVAKRNCQSRSIGGLAAATKTWLSIPHLTVTLFTLPIASIDSSLRNWNKPSNCSYPKFGARWDRQN